MGIARDTKKLIETELLKYPVTFDYGHGRDHPFVRVTPKYGGDSRKIHYSKTCGDPRALLNIKTQIKKTLASIGVEPLNEFKREVGVLGEAMVEQIAASAPKVIQSIEPESTSVPPPAKPFASSLRYASNGPAEVGSPGTELEFAL